MSGRQYIAVAAIDFGTTFSGWACSFRHELNKNEMKFKVGNWNSGLNISHKAPTSVLIHSDGNSLVAFGYEAEDRYVTLADEGQHADYYFFQRFKMMLYQQKMIGRNTTLTDASGKRLSALKVFELSIRFLKDNLLSATKANLSGGLAQSDIFWTLTVPAIWNERAKKFMREAAIKAGIDSSHLAIVLEPEAASVFCRHLPISRAGEGSLVSLDVGDRYVVVDCGGGTVDICCHEIVAGFNLKEVYAVKGEALGGTTVDLALEKMMIEIFGEKSWNFFKENHFGDYLIFLREFEVKKRKLTPTDDYPLTMQLPNMFVAAHETITESTVSHSVRSSSFGDRIEVSKGNKIRIDADCCRTTFFKDVTNRLWDLLKALFENEEVAASKVILLVGGFGESEMIQNCLRESCTDKQQIVPDEAGLAVVKGAVIYGHNTSIIEQRIARYTYGKREILNFDDSYHNTEKIMYEDGVARVHAFIPLIHYGELIPENHEVEISTTVPVRDDQKNVCIRLYAVDSKDQIPRVVDHPNCIKLGRLIVPITDLSIPREERLFRVKFKFGSTEISATVIEQSSGESTEGNFDFIG